MRDEERHKEAGVYLTLNKLEGKEHMKTQDFNFLDETWRKLRRGRGKEEHMETQASKFLGEI